MMTIGTIVYLCWYDFNKKTENVCKGEVVDNSLWDGTKWQGYVNVLFQPPHAAAPFCHHFPEDRLSLTPDNVPHDDCYLVCGKKTRSYEHDATVKPKPQQPSDAWQRVQQFKQDHWDYQHGHLDTDALDEYYDLWRDAIAIKRGYSEITCHYPEITKGYQEITGTCQKPNNFSNNQPQPAPKLTTKQKRSTGAIQYTDSLQTSIFD